MKTIRNYTSEVPVDRSVSLIEHELVRAGATAISKWYEGEPKALAGITFQIPTGPGVWLTFKLPAKWRACYELFYKNVKKPNERTIERVTAQAQRTAWKLLYEWVTIQVTLIELEQVEAIEVFLPYVYDAEKDITFFERLKGSNFKALTAGGARETKT